MPGMPGDPRNRSATLARAGVFLTAVMWGLSFVATKMALMELSPVTVIFSRFVIGTVVLLLIVAFRGESLRPPADAWPSLALMGFIGIFVHQLVQITGLTMTTAVKSGWLIGMIPIWSALLSGLVLHERFGVQKISGLALGTVGAVIVVTRGDLNSTSLQFPTTRGDLLMLASTVNWAVYTIAGRKTLSRLGGAKASALSTLLGTAMLAPLFLYTGGWRELPQLSSTGWGALLFLGIACSGLGLYLWFAALETIDTSQAAAFLYLEPLATLSAAVPLLGETVAVSTILGGALVLLGVFIVQRG